MNVERRNIEFGDGNVSYSNYQEYTELPDADYTTSITTINGPFMFIQQIEHQLPKWLQTLIRVFLEENNYGPFITKPVSDIIWGYDDPFLSFLKNTFLVFSKYLNLDTMLIRTKLVQKFIQLIVVKLRFSKLNYWDLGNSYRENSLESNV